MSGESLTYKDDCMRHAIRVEDISKQYCIGVSQTGTYRTLRESVSESAARTIGWLRTAARRRVAAVVQRRASAPDTTLWALKDVSFEIEPGEVVGIIGRNGAGKSTLLKILSRITQPSAGRVELRGRVGSLLEVGTGFHPELTGRENIFLNGAILGMTRREIARKFDEIVAFAEIDRLLDTPVKRYSSGMYVRLAFAVAAHLEPEILLVDEVLAVGDAAFQKKCLGKLGEVAHSGRTVIFVSHNMPAIQQLCGRALLVVSGTLGADGCTESVVSDYLNDALSSDEGDFDLTQHPARSSSHQPIIRRLTIRSADGSPTSRFFPDEGMVAELSVVPSAPIRDPRVAIAIEDRYGCRITTVASYFQTESLPDIERPCRVRCVLPPLRLGEGRYLLSVSIGTRYAGLLDSMNCVAWFEVGWRNSFGNGEPYQSVFGPVLTESHWSVQEEQSACPLHSPRSFAGTAPRLRLLPTWSSPASECSPSSPSR